MKKDVGGKGKGVTGIKKAGQAVPKLGTKELPMTLEKVIGINARNNNGLALNPTTGDLAYPAGSVVCIYNPKENRQTRFLFGKNNRPFSCVCYSPNGKYLAAAEGTCKQPEILVWEFNSDGSVAPEPVSILHGHKLCIGTVLFSPDLEYLVSLGDRNDKGLLVWNWKLEQKVTCNKLSKFVRAVAFAESGEFFVTAGVNHLK